MRYFSKFFFVLPAILCACSTNNEKIVIGTLTMGHEVSAFVPDNQEKEYWLIDKSGDLYKQYQEIAPIESGAYIPVRAELKVKELPKMQDGFGAEYDGTYDVIETILITPMKK